MHEVVEAATVFFREHRSDLVQHLQFFVKHGHLDVAAEDVSKLGTRNFDEISALQNRNARIHRSLEAGKLRFGVRPVSAAKLHFKFLLRGEIGERSVAAIGDQNKVDGFVGIAATNTKWQSEFGKR